MHDRSLTHTVRYTDITKVNNDVCPTFVLSDMRILSSSYSVSEIKISTKVRSEIDASIYFTTVRCEEKTNTELDPAIV